MKYNYEPNGDLTLSPESPDDFRRFIGIRTVPARKYLFKYARVTPYLLDSLREGYLWLSKPGDFNDPFDCKVLIDYQLTDEQLSSHISFKEAAEGDHSAAERFLRLEGRGAYAFASRYAIDSRELNHNSVKSLSRLLNIAQLAKRSALLDSMLGVCCFTEDPSSILMWSHYGGNHTGVCLRFRHRSSTLSDFAFPVQYRSRMWAPRARSNDAIAQARALIRSTLVKSIVWKYEREWRIVGFEAGEDPFDPDDLQGLVLGMRVSRTDCKHVLSVLRRKKYRHVEVLQAYQDPTKYRLQILPQA